MRLHSKACKASRLAGRHPLTACPMWAPPARLPACVPRPHRHSHTVCHYASPAFPIVAYYFRLPLFSFEGGVLHAHISHLLTRYYILIP